MEKKDILLTLLNGRPKTFYEGKRKFVNFKSFAGLDPTVLGGR